MFGRRAQFGRKQLRAVTPAEAVRIAQHKRRVQDVSDWNAAHVICEVVHYRLAPTRPWRPGRLESVAHQVGETAVVWIVDSQSGKRVLAQLANVKDAGVATP